MDDSIDMPCPLHQTSECDATDCLVLHPTLEEFGLGLRKYLQFHVENNSRWRDDGVIKVVAPPGFADFNASDTTLRDLVVKPT